MTGKLGDQGLDTLERRFQALRDQIGAMPEACRPELEGALQELSQAIAALRADREAGETPRPELSRLARKRQDSPAPAAIPFCTTSSTPFPTCSPSSTGTSTSS